MMKPLRKIAYVAAILLLQAFNNANASRINTISTLYSWHTDSSTFPVTFGKSGFSTFGQTFTAPIREFLGFEFWLHSDWPLWASGAVAEVYHWSGPLIGPGGHAYGKPLYKGPFSHYGLGFEFTALEVIFPEVLLLAPDYPYIALLTISDPAVYELSQHSGVWGMIEPYTNSHHYKMPNDGGFQWQNTGNDPSRLTTAPWDTLDNFGSLAWSGYFLPGIGIPEIDCLAGGSALTLVCTALALLSERRKRVAS